LDTDLSGGILRVLTLREAIASVACTHEADCGCTTCLAAGGDEDALAEVLLAVSELIDADEEAKAG
jgi:hypothetical protein